MSAVGGTGAINQLPLAFANFGLNAEQARSNAAFAGANILTGGAAQQGAPQDVLSGIFGGLAGAARGGGLDSFLGNIFKPTPTFGGQNGVFVNGGLVA